MEKEQSNEIVVSFKNFLGMPKKTFSDFDDMLIYYIYAHEFAWGNYDLNMNYLELKEYLTDKYNEYFYKKDIPVDKMWILMTIVILRDTATKYDYIFATNTLDFVLKKQEQLTKEELEMYANMVTYVYFKEYTPFPLLIPSLTKEFDSKFVYLVSHFSDLIDMSSEVSKVIKENLKKEDVNMDDYIRIVKDDYKYDYGLTTFEEHLTNLFISYSSSSLIMDESKLNKEDLYDLYEASVVSFLKRIAKKNIDLSKFKKELLAIGTKHFKTN